MTSSHVQIRRALVLEQLEGRVLLSTILVTNLADSGTGSLRQAIVQANGDSAGDVINFDPSVTGQITLLSPLPALSTNLVLSGPGASILAVARSSDPTTSPFAVLSISPNTLVTITGLTIANGAVGLSGGGVYNAGILSIANCTIRNNLSGFRGGGILNVGTLTITNSRVTDNQAEGGGGGIANFSGELTITNCVVAGNHVASTLGFGGGVLNETDQISIPPTKSAIALITNSTITGNSAGYNGGGVFNYNSLSQMTMSACTVSENTAPKGGGLGSSGTLYVKNLTITGNSAEVGGGVAASGRVFIEDSTISDNAASRFGGGIACDFGGVSIQATIFSNPQGGNLAISQGFPPTGNIGSLGYNLFSDTPTISFAPTDLINTDPLLAPLADNGGPTQTMALLPGSPAIDAGVTVDGITTDQRGVPRPQGTAPDIGAFESQGFLFTISAGDGQSATVGTAFTEPLVVTVSTSDGHPLAGAVVAFSAPTSGASAILSSASATTDANGHANVTAIANNEAGSYSVTTQAGGVKGPAFTLTNVAAPPPVLPTPTVVSVQRFGVHLQPTFIAVRFSEPMDAGRAENLANYRLVSAGRDRRFGTRDDRTIRLRSVQYDPGTQSIRLSPSIRLPLRLTYQLTINGTPPDGLASTDGIFLGGAGASQPGTNYVATIDRGSLLLPATSRIMKRERMRQRFQEHHPRPSSFANGGEFR